ncbi:hypothetical protein Tco_1554522 [Tanacetum coccineum]
MMEEFICQWEMVRCLSMSGNTQCGSFLSSKEGGRKAPTNSSNILTSNPYDLLSQEFDPENYTRSGGDPNLVQYDMESEEEVEVVFDETTNLLICSILRSRG